MGTRFWPSWSRRPASWRFGHLSDATITFYLAGELPPDAADTAQRHLVRCERCARACEEQQFAHQAVTALARERRVPHALDAHLRATLASAAPRPAPRPLRFLWAAAGARQVVRRASPAESPPRAHRGSGFWSLAAVLLIALASAVIFGTFDSPARRTPTSFPDHAAVPGWACQPPADQRVPGVWQWSRANVTLNAIAMLSPDSGWAVGEFNGSRGLILTYSAGGWSVFASTNNAVLRGIAMDRPDDGWAAGEDCTHPGRSLMLHYTDGTWVQVPVPDVGPLSAVAMVCDCSGWATGQRGLLRYANGTWTAVSFSAADGPSNLSALSLASPGTGWAAGSGGAFAREHGDAWSPAPRSGAQASAPDWNALAVLPDGSGWAAGSLGVGGHGELASIQNEQWAMQVAPVADPLYGLALSTRNEGWAVGGDASGVILHLHQGYWTVAHMPWVPGLRAVTMVSPAEAWAVGRDGAILHLRGGVWESVTCAGL